MKILVIDTASKSCLVAIYEDFKCICEKINTNELTHSQKLMPLIDSCLKESNNTLNDINLIICSQGPGSFTGIRIGISTVKAFNDVKNIPLIGVSSLESLAYNVSNSNVCSIIDAKHNNVYAGVFDFTNSVCIGSKLISCSISELNNFIDKNNITFVGDGSIIYKDFLKTNFPNSCFSLTNNFKSISYVKAGLNHYISGDIRDSSQLSPIYLKKSQAERALEGEK